MRLQPDHPTVARCIRVPRAFAAGIATLMKFGKPLTLYRRVILASVGTVVTSRLFTRPIMSISRPAPAGLLAAGLSGALAGGLPHQAVDLQQRQVVLPGQGPAGLVFGQEAPAAAA